MSATPVRIDGRGRLVVPAELRDRLGLHPGTPLLLLETPHGIVVTTREQAKAMVAADLVGPSLAAELVSDRRRAAVTEDEDGSQPGPRR